MSSSDSGDPSGAEPLLLLKPLTRGLQRPAVLDDDADHVLWGSVGELGVDLRGHLDHGGWKR